MPITLVNFLLFFYCLEASQSMVMGPLPFGRSEIGLNSVLASCCMAPQFTAGAHALVRLDMGAGGHFLQEDFDRFLALDAFKGQHAGGF
jgi:hypothetical protein